MHGDNLSVCAAKNSLNVFENGKFCRGTGSMMWHYLRKAAIMLNEK